MPFKFNPLAGQLDIVNDQGAGSGDVTGPASSTDNAITRFNGTTGKSIQNSSATLSDAGAMAGVASLTLASGATVTEFSTDGTLAGDSDSAVPTEKAVKTYVDAAGGGNVSNTGTPADGQIAVWTDATTIEGDSALSFDTTTDTLSIGASGALNFGAVTVLNDSAGTTTLSNIDALDATTEATLESAIDSLPNLVTVGTIGTGTWQGTTIAVDQGGTGQTSYVNGQLLIGNTTGNTLTKATLTGGTNLTVVNGTGSITLNVDDAFLLNTGDTGTGVYDFGGATSFEIPNSTTPTVNADGEIAVDTSVTDWSHGILKYYGGEEMGVVAMPISQFTSPTDNYVVTYNATNDEFELQAGGGGSSPLTTDNDLYYYNSGDARLAGPATPYEILNSANTTTLGWRNLGELQSYNLMNLQSNLSSNGTGATFDLRFEDSIFGMYVYTGTDSTGKVSIRHTNTSSKLTEGSNIVCLDYIVKINQLSNATDEYELQIGWHGRWVFGTGDTDGIFFKYERSADGANWRAVSRASATETNTDTSVAVSTTAQHLRILVDNSATTVKFYIDGSLVATHTSSDNIPPDTTTSALATFIQNTAGTGAGRYAIVFGPLMNVDNT